MNRRNFLKALALSPVLLSLDVTQTPKKPAPKEVFVGLNKAMKESGWSTFSFITTSTPTGEGGFIYKIWMNGNNGNVIDITDDVKLLTPYEIQFLRGLY